MTAPYFLGEKIEAFEGRAPGDYFTSRDLEDPIYVIDRRATIAGEVAGLLAAPGFIDGLPGNLLPDAASQAELGWSFVG